MVIILNSKRNKKGIIFTLVAVLLVALLGFGSLVGDFALAYATKSRVKTAVDMAALAGISQLEDSSSVTSAKNTALDFLNNNLSETINGFMDLSLSDTSLQIKVGVFDEESRTFTWDESDSDINSISISYTLPAMTIFGNIYMIESIPVSGYVIASKQVAGSAAPNTVFPIAISDSVLSSVHGMSYSVNLYQSGGSTNSYFTSYDGNAMPAEILDQFNFWGLESYNAYAPPPALSTGDTVKYYNGSDVNIYYNIPHASNFEGMTYIFPVVTNTDGTNLQVEGFVGGEITDVDIINKRITITVKPGHIDNDHSGLKVGQGADEDIDPTYTYLLANSFGIVI